jgi:glucokinase
MKFIIGVDLGGTNIKFGLFDDRLKLVDKQILNTARFKGKQQLIEILASGINDIIAKNGLEKKDIRGVGLGLPGPVDFKKGIVYFFPNIPGWKKVPLRKILKDKLGLPVYLDNDVKVMALAEYNLGAAKKFKNVVCITLGTGIGGAILTEGRLYRGSGNAAGEVGHIPINENGPKCNCGGKACIEAYVGNRRILAKAKKALRREISLEELTRLARQGNRQARKIWQDVGTKLGVALTGVVNFCNPDCIVVGGGVANAGKILFDQIKKTIKERAMALQAGEVKVVRAALGENAGMIGAAILVIIGDGSIFPA